MIGWLLLAFLFWKPIWLLGYAIYHRVSGGSAFELNMEAFKEWWATLVKLVKPGV